MGRASGEGALPLKAEKYGDHLSFTYLRSKTLAKCPQNR